jgi:tetratricopeptide (TPR) repeat protein
MIRVHELGSVLMRSGILKSLMILGLAVGSLRAQAVTKAEDLYRRTEYRQSLALLQTNTNDAAVNNLIGRNYFMMGDFKKAVDFFQKAAEAEPNNSDYALWLGRGWGRRAETSNPFFAPGYASRAKDWLEKSVQLNDRNQEALSDLFDYYLEAPGFLGGGFDKAQDVARKIANVDAAEGYFARARLAEKRREFDTAEVQLRRAVESAPRQVGRVLDLAKFLANQGKQQESDALLAKAEKMAPETPKVWYAKADILIKEKRNLDEAKRLLQKYMQSSAITPDDPSKDSAERLLKQVAGGA